MGNTIRFKRWRLLSAATELLARTGSFDETMDVLRNSAQAILRSDGVIVVKRKGKVISIAADAIGELSEDECFQLAQCVSTIAMIERAPVVILDIANDHRMSHSLGLSTLLASMVVAPIGFHPSVAAIGAYWRTQKPVEEDALVLLGMLAQAAGATLERLADSLTKTSPHAAA